MACLLTGPYPDEFFSVWAFGEQNFTNVVWLITESSLSVMVWAGVTSEDKTLLVFIDTNVKINSEVYRKVVLVDNSLPRAKRHFAQRPFVLQQD